MRAPLPPIDHVARALVAKGAREHAIALLEAAARRPGPDRMRCEALLGAMRARPADRPTGPMAALDATLVEALASNGMLREARAVAQGGRLAARGAIELAAALEQVLDDPPASMPEAQRARWAEVIGGSLPALEQIEREIAGAPGWIRARAPVAGRLLRGFSVHAPTAAGAQAAESASVTLPEEVRAAIAERVSSRDLPGALAVARGAPQEHAGAAEIVAILARLVAATERLMEEPQMGRGGSSTVPLGGHGLALFQLRMGNVADAERGFRQLLLEQSGDGLAKERLHDVSVLRRAIDPSAVPAMPAADPRGATPPVGWLDKRNARPAAEGWAAGPTPRVSAPPKINEWDEEVSTNVLRPEQEAELMLRSGRAERALVIYRALLEGQPTRPGLAQRVAEIEAMIAENAAPLPDEATVQRDVSDLRAARVARRSLPGAVPVPAAALEAAAAPAPGASRRSAWDDEEPTQTHGALPPGALEERAPADPLADTGARPAARDDDTPLEIVTGPEAHVQAHADTGDPDGDIVTVHRIVRID